MLKKNQDQDDSFAKKYEKWRQNYFSKSFVRMELGYSNQCSITHTEFFLLWANRALKHARELGREGGNEYNPPLTLIRSETRYARMIAGTRKSMKNWIGSKSFAFIRGGWLFVVRALEIYCALSLSLGVFKLFE